MFKDYYKILGIQKDASFEEIKAAFKIKAHVYHPDKNNGDDTKFKEINEAYSILKEKESRLEYDFLYEEEYKYSNKNKENNKNNKQQDPKIENDEYYENIEELKQKIKSSIPNLKKKALSSFDGYLKNKKIRKTEQEKRYREEVKRRYEKEQEEARRQQEEKIAQEKYYQEHKEEIDREKQFNKDKNKVLIIVFVIVVFIVVMYKLSSAY